MIQVLDTVTQSVIKNIDSDDTHGWATPVKTKRYRTLVYGTLKSGNRNHSYMNGCPFLGEARTSEGYALWNVENGIFPGVTEVGGCHRVVGELYAMDVSALYKLDSHEGHPFFYERKLIDLEDGRKAYIYIFKETHPRAYNLEWIPGGNWLPEHQLAGTKL